MNWYESSKVLLLSAALAAPALGQAATDNRIFVASTGHVSARFLGSDAAFINVLGLASPTFSRPIFTNHSTPVGTTVDLGFFQESTELVFDLFVVNTGYTYFTGPASANPDGVTHARTKWNSQSNVIDVGFEDLWGGGDRDYDDMRFRLTNVRNFSSSPTDVSMVPEPAGWLLLMGGLGFVSAIMRWRREKGSR